MSPTAIGVLGLGILVIGLLSGIPVGFVMAAVGFGGFSILVSLNGGLNIVAKDIFVTFSSYSLTVIPMFVLMGSIAFASGASGRLYDTAHKFFGQRHGGLSMATIGTCAAFAAMCGSANAASAALGKVALPEMSRYHYDPALSSGCVASGGTLGVLIPPSTVFIIYGIITGTSIGKLFISGIVPGILLTVLFLITVYLLCRLQPSLGPAGPPSTLKEKLRSLSGIAEMLMLFVLVIGGLFIGIFTPTEAGGVGAVGALLVGLARRKLTWQGFVDALFDTAMITCMLFVIVAGAVIFGHFIAVTKIPFAVAGWLEGLAFPSSIVIGIIILIFFIGGCFIDILALILLTVPIFFPVVKNLGFDPIWFGVIVVLIAQIGAITPPVGVCVYVIHGVSPDIPLQTIFRGTIPFLIAMLVCVVLLIIFPDIALFLPSLMQ